MWPGMPMRSAILAVPMFDEYWKISGTVSTRRLPWKSLMVKPPMRIGAVASKLSLSVTLPESSPMAMVKVLKVEPISNVPFDMRFIQPSSAPSAGLFGS
ncbi:hypothetical protein D3C72_2072890 [compost metagenome]